MNPIRSLNQRLERVYAAESRENRSLAKANSLILAILTVVVAILSVLLQSTGQERFVLIVLTAFFAVLFGLLHGGKLKAVSILLSASLTVAFCFIVLMRPFTSYFELYMLGAFLCFSTGLTSLIGYYSWQPYLVMGAGSVAVVIDLFTRIFPANKLEGQLPQWDDGLIVAAMGWTLAFVMSRVHGNARALLSEIRAENETGKERLEILNVAMGASRESLELGGKLNESAKSTTTLAAEVVKELSDASESMKELDGRNRGLSGELEAISESTHRARASAETQAAVVNQTSAAVEEMTASIRNITGITKQRMSAVAELERSTTLGRSVIEGSSRSMTELEASAASILGVVKVINSVASQTNLLAMNAAIEAAHAGEYGRGFSVVADEIRKLSEQTGKNVKTVAETVKKTMADIRVASDNNVKANAAFADIARESEMVATAMEEIIRGMDELALGTNEINEGIGQSVSSTDELRSAVLSVDERVASASGSLAAMNAASGKVLSELSKIGERMDSIRREAENVRKIGESNEEGLRKISQTLVAKE